MEDGKKLYDLFPPDKTDYRHPNVGEKEHLPTKDYFFEYKKGSPIGLANMIKWDDQEIDCQVKRKKELFLSYTGCLYPCCWLGTVVSDSPGGAQFNGIMDKKLIDLNNTELTVEAAIDNLRIIEESWSKKNIISGKLLTCAKFCGKTVNNKVSYIKYEKK